MLPTVSLRALELGGRSLAQRKKVSRSRPVARVPEAPGPTLIKSFTAPERSEERGPRWLEATSRGSHTPKAFLTATVPQ